MDIPITTLIIAQLFGLVSWIFLLYSYTKEKINDLLFFQIFVALFDLGSYLLLGADAGMLICLVELIKTILYYKTDKDRLVFYLGIISYSLIGLLAFDHFYAIFPVLASIIDAYGTSKDSKSANITSIISHILWIMYDLIILSYIGVINCIVVIICNIVILFRGYSRLLRISKFRIVKSSYLNRNIIDKIYNLDLKNYGEKHVWDKNYQMDLYNRNKDSIYIIKYKHDFVGYINYLNVKKDLYFELKNQNTMPNVYDLDSIGRFKRKRKSFLVMESINVEREYEKAETIVLIDKRFRNFLRLKYSRKIYINGILGYGYTFFEKQVYESIGFKKIKDLENNVTLYELDNDSIRRCVYVKR